MKRADRSGSVSRTPVAGAGLRPVWLVVWLSSILCQVTIAAEPRTSGVDQRPNVVLILADDLGWADLGCYGADLHETPNLDRLAREGVRFTDAYAAPVCSPSRAALMTGKHPARLHMTTWYESSRNPPRNRKLVPPITVADLPHDEVTIAECLRPAGYQTAMVGKWHLGQATHYPETQGFDINIGGTFWGAPSTHFFPYRGQFGNEDGIRYVPHLEWGKPGEYLTDRLTDEALKVIDRAGDQPFFLYLAHHAVHTPIEAKDPLIQHYRNRIKPEFHHQNAAYAAMVQSLDESVGRVLAKLESRGIEDQTVVIFASDNGGYVNRYQDATVTSNHPLRSGKGSLYEGGTRVPLIVRWPGHTPAGGVVHQPVVVMDLLPTILAMVGLKPDGGLDGVSLVNLLEEPESKLDREDLFWHYPHYYPTTTPVSAIRSGDWKLLEYFEDQHVELYQLADDIGEKQDLSEQRPEVVRRLRDRLHTWWREVDAQLPVSNTGKNQSP